MSTLLVFSHLRWDFVFQRPQHLLSRLARRYRVIFIEEPVFAAGSAQLVLSSPVPGVTVCKPYTPVAASGFHDDQLPNLSRLTADLIPEGERPIVWFYTPMALPLLQQFDPQLVVYDCMDELSAFANAPRQLLQREAALLNIADLVFTGGPSLYEAKRHRTAHAHCFPSSVDAAHFGQALHRSDEHPLQRDIAHPRLGYYGVIDERFDLELVDAIALAHPEWQLVLVGPVIKINPLSLPRRPNIHYFGQQPYAALPQFLAGWDVCLMPFALNDSTRFISPTKVLEYMAAELPIVSTAINDVVRPYPDTVRIGYNADEFIAHCAAALALSAEARTALLQKMGAVVANTSWDRTVQEMNVLLSSTVPGQHRNRHADLNAADTTMHDDANAEKLNSERMQLGRIERRINPLRGVTRTSATSCLIVGAGPTGLSAAYHYGANAVLLEKNRRVGGWCRSVRDNGFTFDYAGHIMFSNDPYVLKLYDKLLGENIHWQNREAWVYSKNVFTRYPFQGALYGLPPAVIKECIVGAIEARYGKATPAADAKPGTTQGTACANQAPDDCCADGAADLSTGKKNTASAAAPAPPVKPENFEAFIYQVWGAGIAKHFAIPYNQKLWTVPLTEMETSWLGGRVPLPDLGEIIEGALEPVGKPMGPNARFGYPLKGGFEALVAGFLPHIAGKIETEAQVARISPVDHTVALIDGRRFVYDHLISTMPLPELVKMIGDEAPLEVRAAAAGLCHLSVRCVNLGIGRADITDKHWIYYPEQTIFHRIFVQGNASPHCNPPGGFGLTCEISYSPTKPLPLDGDALVARCVADLIEVGLINADDPILTANQVDMPYAYVVYDHARAANVATVKTWMAQHDIVLSGRYSEWEYYNSDHAFVAGKKAAETVLALQRVKGNRATARLSGK